MIFGDFGGSTKRFHRGNRALRGPHEAKSSRTILGDQASTTAYARALKAAEVPPEQALERVKDVARTPPPPFSPTTRTERLADDVVVWFVAEYYRAD